MATRIRTITDEQYVTLLEDLASLRSKFRHVIERHEKLVRDEWFGGVPTFTCVAIGPAPATDIDPITGHLALL